MKPEAAVIAAHSPTWRGLLLAGMLAAWFAAFGWFWLKLPYDFSGPRQTAAKFIGLLRQDNYSQAHEMTLKNGYTGKTPEELRDIASWQLCVGNLEYRYTFPPQSNGNRLRRWLHGDEVEMPEIYVEFEDSPCLMGIQLRHMGHGQWKIFRFASHAG